MEFTFLENALIHGIFTHAPPHSKLVPKLLLWHPKQKEIADSLRQHSFENLFPPIAERGGGNYDLLYQHLVRKNEDEPGTLGFLYFVSFAIFQTLQFCK